MYIHKSIIDWLATLTIVNVDFFTRRSCQCFHSIYTILWFNHMLFLFPCLSLSLSRIQRASASSNGLAVSERSVVNNSLNDASATLNHALPWATPPVLRYYIPCLFPDYVSLSLSLSLSLSPSRARPSSGTQCRRDSCSPIIHGNSGELLRLPPQDRVGCTKNCWRQTQVMYQRSREDQRKL